MGSLGFMRASTDYVNAAQVGAGSLRTISNASNSLAPALLSLRTDGTEGPLFILSDPFSASVSELKAAAERIDVAVPLYVLLNPPLDVDCTTEGMANRLVRAIREVRACGPYRILGWGFGGIFAYESAIQLIGQDEEVSFFGLVDASYDSAPSSVGMDANRRALARYEPQRLPLSVHCFVSRGPSPMAPDRSDWRRLVSDCDVTYVGISRDPEARRDEYARAVGTAISNALRPADEFATAPARYQYDPLVMIQSSKSAVAPIFCIPGAGDNATAFLPFVEALGPAWPLHALQARGLDGQWLPHATAEIAADGCLRAIAQARPTGQLHIVGHSFGGWVAFETAIRLSASGREVASLTIIDSEPPDNEDGVREFTHVDMLAHWIELVELDAGRALGIKMGALDHLDMIAQLNLIHERMTALGLLPARTTPSVLEGPIRTFAAALRTSYCPKSAYAGRVNLVYASDSRIGGTDNVERRDHMFEAWKRWAPNATAWHGPGNHITILKHPHVQALASAWLKNACAP